jgi:hypothetical protein
MARSRAQNRDRHPHVPRLAYTVDEFCAAGHFSRSYYEAEKRAGRGPKETLLGRAVRITPANAEAWIASRLSKYSRRDRKPTDTGRISAPSGEREAMWRKWSRPRPVERKSGPAKERRSDRA